ncbi:hypothetical protein AB6880_05645 [Rahnella inusitata]
MTFRINKALMAAVGSLYTLLSIFLAKGCIPMPEAVKILRHHNVTSDV